VIVVRAGLKIVVASQPVDFREGINSLAALVSQALNANPYCGDVFIFRSKRMDRLKLLAWDGTGMVLMTKWLEESRFIWPPIRDGAVHLSATIKSILQHGKLCTRATHWSYVRSGRFYWRFKRMCSMHCGWRFVSKIFPATQLG
jgi:transposase